MQKKRNLTLALDDNLIHKARIAAARRRTSLSNLIRRNLEELVAGDQQEDKARERLKARMSRPVLEIGTARWTRESLHDRS